MPTLLELEDAPAETWPRLVRELQKQHVHHHVTIEEWQPSIEEDDLATWVVVESAPLLGLSFTSMPQPAIEVAWRTPTGETRFHTAVSPARLRHMRDPSGREVELRIDREDGGTTLLYFTR